MEVHQCLAQFLPRLRIDCRRQQFADRVVNRSDQIAGSPGLRVKFQIQNITFFHSFSQLSELHTAKL